MNRTIKYTHSEVTAQVFHYFNEDDLRAYFFDLEDITSISIDKNISSTSATFSIQLSSGQNWKNKVFNGDWVVIYFSIDGNKRLKLLGNVDRVSRTKEVNASDGKMIVRYNIHGRNFGKIFEKTSIYINPFDPQTLSIDAVLSDNNIVFQGTPTFIIKKLIDVFLGGNEIRNIPSLKNQWFIPKGLKKLILGGKSGPNIRGTSESSFIDILDKTSKIDDVLGYKLYLSFSSLSENLWNTMKQSSHEAMNEMFLELVHDGEVSKPTIFLRTLPFTDESFDKSGSIEKTVGKFTRFLELPRVKITDDDIINEDIGQSDHVKFNYLMMAASGDAWLKDVNIGMLITNDNNIPKINLDSIKKNGLLLRTEKSDFAFLAESPNKEVNDTQILIGWNRLLVNWWENAHKLETGTMKVLYNPDIELGKVLEVKYNFLNETYVYYIEGYSINWQFPEVATMNLSLTRGKKLISDSKTDFTEESNENDKIFTGQNKVKR